jgi:hypothetical protein
MNSVSSGFARKSLTIITTLLCWFSGRWPTHHLKL